MLTTWIGLSRGHVELNPFAAFIIDHPYGFASFTLLKLALALAIGSFFIRRGGLLTIVSLMLLDALTLFVVLNNMWRLLG